MEKEPGHQREHRVLLSSLSEGLFHRFLFLSQLALLAFTTFTRAIP